MTWTCPKCGRAFGREGQSHSCKPSVPIDAHFEARPAWMREAFDRMVKRLGDVRVDGVAKGIHLAAGSTFGGVTMTRTKMRVEFLLAREVKSPRVVKLERLGPTRLAHHVELTSAEDADAELLGWLVASRREH